MEHHLCCARTFATAAAELCTSECFLSCSGSRCLLYMLLATLGPSWTVYGSLVALQKLKCTMSTSTHLQDLNTVLLLANSDIMTEHFNASALLQHPLLLGMTYQRALMSFLGDQCGECTIIFSERSRMSMQSKVLQESTGLY